MIAGVLEQLPHVFAETLQHGSVFWVVGWIVEASGIFFAAVEFLGDALEVMNQTAQRGSFQSIKGW